TVPMAGFGSGTAVGIGAADCGARWAQPTGPSIRSAATMTASDLIELLFRRDSPSAGSPAQEHAIREATNIFTMRIGRPSIDPVRPQCCHTLKRAGPSAQKPVQLPEMLPRTLPEMRRPVFTTLDSPSVHWRPKPAFPETVVLGCEMKSPEPKMSRIPSPG